MNGGVNTFVLEPTKEKTNLHNIVIYFIIFKEVFYNNFRESKLPKNNGTQWKTAILISTHHDQRAQTR